MKKKADNEFWKGFAIGAGTGFAGGNFTGLKIGVTIK